MAGNYVLEFSS